MLKWFLATWLFITPVLAAPGGSLTISDAFNALAPGAQFTCKTQIYSDCTWLSGGITQPTQLAVTNWLTAHANDAANEATRLSSFNGGNMANCTPATLALTADCIAFVEDKLKTMSISQFNTWYAANINSAARVQSFLGLEALILAHQIRIQ